VIVEHDQLIQSWLDLQCQIVTGVVRAAFLSPQQDGNQYQPRAVWPKGTTPTAALSNGAALAVHRQQFVVMAKDKAPSAARQEGDIIAYPLRQGTRLLGVVAIEVTSRDRSGQRVVANALQSGAISLAIFMQNNKSGSKDRLLPVVELVARSVEHDRFQAAAGSVLTELAARFKFERVSLGFLRGHNVQLDVISRNASVDEKTNLAVAIGASMEEALDQDITIVFPKRSDQKVQVVRAHTELARTYGAGAVCTVPISHHDRLVGAITLEHQEGHAFDGDTVALYQNIIALIGPILWAKYQQDRWIGAKAWSGLIELSQKLTGPRHVLLKLATASCLTLAIFMTLATGEYRITAEASLEGTVQRMVVAPMPGYVAEANVRAGDLVSEGQVMARLDDKDLVLEQRKWLSEKSQLQKEYREAMAEHDGARVSILRAQLDRATAQLELTEEYLARTSVIAPLSGIVIKGDLSQSLGVPVERGQALFEVAPLASYRVMLEVDEREIGVVRAGQKGRLALAGFPADHLPFVVDRITPVSTTAEGRNFFMVEARLQETPDLLRPGMQGVGKIDAGQHKLAWVWTHGLVDWLHLLMWSRLPWA